jgi:tRNA-Thr(GGU) m(6)t(6)A37 methyltransferase TsaA
MESHNFPSIGILHTYFKEKFGVPRQSLMIPEATGVVRLNQVPEYRQALHFLDSFSHIWLIFAFRNDCPWKPTIRPPRVDAPRRVGVFASRSPHRPNPIGMSVVSLEKIDLDAPDGIELHISGIDLLDQTPILDIKPYLPYADSVLDASSGWIKGEIPRFKVNFTEKALHQIQELGSTRHPRLHLLIEQMLEWDPRPTSQRRAMPIEKADSEGRTFGFRIFDLDVQWVIRNQTILVFELSLWR